MQMAMEPHFAAVTDEVHPYIFGNFEMGFLAIFFFSAKAED